MRRQQFWYLWLWLQASCAGCQKDEARYICHVPTIENLFSDTCRIQQLKTAGEEANLDSLRGWVKGDSCQELGSSSFCTFTTATFNEGFGLSVITTEQRLESLSSLPVFAQQEQKKPWGGKASDVSYEQQEVPGKGIGLVATRRISAGELILARTPAVLVDDDAFRGLDQGRLTQVLVPAIEMLPAKHQSEYLKLTTHQETHGHDEKIYNIFAKNNYRTRIANSTDFHATFIDVSRLNHACRPNCGYQFEAATLSQKVYAARDILRGEELTVAYTDPVQNREARQAHLQSSWGFTCTCEHCTAADDEVEQSDARIKRIHELWKELDDYSSASSASTDKAEELVSLYEVEGLKTRIHEAYYRAAIEYNGVGDANQAVRFAMRSMLRGQMMAGVDRPFVEKMRELVKDPKKHWTWKFRIQEDEKDEL